MNSFLDLSFLMPVLAAIFLLIILVVFIVVNGRTRQIQSLTVSQKSFEELAGELKADNEGLKSELAEIKETLHSINKMMKEI